MTTVSVANGRILLVTGGNDRTVRRWDPLSGKQFGDPLTGHDDRVHAVTAVPMTTGRVLLASYSWDNTIRLWEPATGKLVADYRVVAHTGRINAMIAVPMPGDDCTVLVTAGADGTVQLCDPLTGRPMYNAFTEHEDAVYSLAQLPAPDGRTLIVSASSDGTVRTWYPGSRSSMAASTERTLNIHDVAVLQTEEHGPLIASTGSEPGVSLWSLATGEPAGLPLRDRSDTIQKMVTVPVSSAAPNVDTNHMVLAYARDKSVRLWDPAADRQVRDDLTGHTEPVTALTTVPWPDGQTLLASGSDDSIRLWEPNNGVPVGDAFHDPGPICCLAAFSVAGERVGLVSVDAERVLRLWNPVTRQLVASVCTEHTDSVNVVVATYDSVGNVLIATGSADGTVRIWQVDDELCHVATLEHGSPVVAMTELLFPDGDRLLVVASNDHRLRIVDPAKRQAGRALSLLIKIDSLASSANRLVIGSRHGLFVLDVDKKRLETSPGPVDLDPVDRDPINARDVDDLYEYQSRSQRPGAPQQDRMPTAPAGLEELHNEHLDAMLGISRLAPERIGEVRRWLRLAVTPTPTAQNSWGATSTHQLLRRLGKAAVTLEIYANVEAESDTPGTKYHAEQTRLMIHPVCTTVAKELMLHERLTSIEQEDDDTVDQHESAVDLALRVFGVLALLGLDDIQARLIMDAYTTVTDQWSQVDRRDVLTDDAGDAGTQSPHGVSFTKIPLLPRQVLLAAGRVARQFGLSNGNSRFQQALVDNSWSPDGDVRVPARQTSADLANLGVLVVNELYLRAALRAILARPGTRIQEVGDIDVATLLPLFDDLGLHDALLFTSHDPSNSADPNAMVDAVLAIFAAAYLSHDSNISALSRNLPESVNAWLNMSTAPTYPVSSLLETRQPDDITRHSESPPRRDQVTRMEGAPGGKGARALPGKVYRSNRNNRRGLTISRIPGERFFVGDDITIEITQVVNNKVRLKVQAPESMPIEREEIAKSKEKKGHE
jgi:carbon storage regulator CsrA